METEKEEKEREERGELGEEKKEELGELAKELGNELGELGDELRNEIRGRIASLSFRNSFICFSLFLLSLYIFLLAILSFQTLEENQAKINEYYQDIKLNNNLINQLEALISRNVKIVDYSDIWNTFLKTDTHWDRCSRYRNGIKDIFNYKSCFNDKSPHGSKEGMLTREHVWPKSWWGFNETAENEKKTETKKGAYTDLHLVFPAEGSANSVRSYLPYDQVYTNTWNSNGNTFIGWKKGPCSSNGGRTCVEPPDEWKGVIARVILYTSVRYLKVFKYPCPNPNSVCNTNIAVQGSHLNSWFESIIKRWHRSFPPSDAEKTRNNEIFKIQGNRNPFVDHPEYVDMILDF